MRKTEIKSHWELSPCTSSCPGRARTWTDRLWAGRGCRGRWRRDRSAAASPPAPSPWSPWLRWSVRSSPRTTPRSRPWWRWETNTDTEREYLIQSKHSCQRGNTAQCFLRTLMKTHWTHSLLFTKVFRGNCNVLPNRQPLMLADMSSLIIHIYTHTHTHVCTYCTHICD